ncbi:hypothetical protein R3P38DRAFT_3171507 [Favolaschia claudopus]|uniref:Uncharacterized protein n=1 Tax=Favolaschia claudopus TaxID=2862362 RepID=A0AAW0DQZ4_9AGAR
MGRKSKYTSEERSQRRAHAAWEYRQRNKAATNEKARLRMRAQRQKLLHAPSAVQLEYAVRAEKYRREYSECTLGATLGWRASLRNNGGREGTARPPLSLPAPPPHVPPDSKIHAKHGDDTVSSSTRPRRRLTFAAHRLHLRAEDSESDTESEHSEGGWEADNEAGKYGENYGTTVYIIGKQTVYLD